MTCSELQCQVLERFEDLEAMCRDWRALYRDLGQPNFFIDPRYLRVWWRHFGQDSQPLVFVVRDQEGLRAVFPLRRVRRRLGPVTVRVVLAMSNVESAKTQWLIKGEFEPVIDAWLDLILSWRSWDVLHLPETPVNTPGLTYLWRRLSDRGRKYLDHPCEGATILDVSGDYKAYWDGRPKKKKRNMKWAVGRIKKAGSVGYQVSRPEDDPGRWRQRVFDLAGRTWQAAEGTGLHQPPRAAFYADLVREFLPLGQLRICVLTLDGRDIAFYLGYLQRGVFYIFKTGYDQTYHRLYPGLVLLDHLLRDCFHDPAVRQADFITSKPIFQAWTEGTAPKCDLTVYHRSLRGRTLSLVQTVILPWSRRVLGRPRPAD